MQYDAELFKNQWMPFTSNRDFKSSPRMIMRGEGVYLFTPDGDRIIDASSGLFCCAAGHSRKEIADAVHRQLLELSYTAPFQMGHVHSFRLASKLAEITPAGLDKLFFVNSGSESIDTAIKIALAYHYARGEGQRQRLVSRERAYHGVNIGGTSLSGMVKNRQAFGVGMPGVCHMRHTMLPEYKYVRGQPKHGVELADDLLRIVQNYGADTIAACFVEPVAGSTGCLVPPEGYLERLREICDEYEILLVFDEVICGFGRTGKPFGAQSFGVTPDLMTMAKALTNAAQPMGAVAVNQNVHDTIMNAAPEKVIELFHGYTYSGHPGACAAGLATLEIYEKEKLFERGAKLSGYFLDAIFELKGIEVITDIRGYGMLGGIDFAPGGRPGQVGLEIQKRLFAAGLHVKATGDAIILAPPLISEEAHIDEIVSILRQVLEQYS